MISFNVASHLTTLSKREPNRSAVIIASSGRSLSFRELDAASDALAAGLMKIGLQGRRVAVMVPPSLEFFTLVFALFKAAVVPVMIDPGMGATSVGACLKDAEPAAFMGVAKAHIARRLFGWARGAVTVNVGRTRFFCDHSLASLPSTSEVPKLTSEVEAGDTAAILFTSGSTGPAKGVVYTHGIFAAQVELLKNIYQIEPGEIDLCTFPLFALFGPVLGMTCIVPTMDFSRPATINVISTITTINKYRVTNLFGSPAVIRRLSAAGTKLPTLRRAISAGAPATLDIIERFSKMLDDPIGSGDVAPLRSRLVFTPYGATEALPVASIGSDELLATRALTESGHGLCLGRPVPGVSVQVIPIDDGPVPVLLKSLPPGEIGEFVVCGPVVTTSYWKRDVATALAKMHDPATGETLHRMGDVGYRDDAGRLWFCGRKSQRVVTDRGTLFTEQVEPVFNTVAGVVQTALVAVGRRAILCVRVVPGAWRGVCAELQLKSQQSMPHCIDELLEYPGRFPMDRRHNSKIHREQLALWAARQLQGN